MTLKQRCYIAVIISVFLGALSYVFKDTKNDVLIGHYPFFITLLVGVALYILLYAFFQASGLLKYWTYRTDKIIFFFTAIGILIFGVNTANKVEEHQDSFWIINGNRWLVDVFASVIALLICYAIFSWIFRQWKKVQALKNENSKAKLALLKNQINPHFFFNTLNNLYSLIKKDPNVAQEYVLKLSDMMRFTIYDGKEETVFLKDEINYLNNFITLQTARYHKTIDLKFIQNIKNLEHSIPPLLFIILLENAFKHGVEKLIDNAFIHIELEESTSHIIFSITNNFDPETQSKSRGIGLKNLKDRLELLYPKGKHKLTIHSQNQSYAAKLELLK